MSFQRAGALMQNAPPLDFVIGSVHMAGKKFHHKDLYILKKPTKRIMIVSSTATWRTCWRLPMG